MSPEGSQRLQHLQAVPSLLEELLCLQQEPTMRRYTFLDQNIFLADEMLQFSIDKIQD